MSDIRFIVGEEVSFLNEPGKAIVKAVLPDGKVRIETEDGFEMDYPASVLVPRFDLRQQQAEAAPEVEEEKGPILEMGGYRVGMQVQVIDQAETALILSFSEDGMAELEFEDLFTKKFPISQLVAVDTLQLKEIEKSVEQVTLRDIGESPKPLHIHRTLKDRKDQGAWEVDLHIQELVDNSYGMMKHEIVQLQLDHFDKKLNEAIERGVNKIIFIHGRGEGRLRTAIREVLKRYPNCEYLDADYRRYGVGATEVRVKYRPQTAED